MKKIILNKSQYNRIFLKENLDPTEIQNLHNLVKSADSKNIELAFELAQGNNYDLETWIRQEYGELFHFLNTYDAKFKRIGNSIKNQLNYILNVNSLFLSHKQITDLPESINKLKNLQKLYLDDNKLTNLPESIGDLINLKELNLEKNELQELPKSISHLKKLNIIYLYDNNIDYNFLKQIWYIKSILPELEIYY